MNITIDENADIILTRAGFCLYSCPPSGLSPCSTPSSIIIQQISRSWRSRRWGARRTTCGLWGSTTGSSWRRNRLTSLWWDWRLRRFRGISGCSWCPRRSWGKSWWRSMGSQRWACCMAQGMKWKLILLGHLRGSSFLHSSWNRQSYMHLIQHLIHRTQPMTIFVFQMFRGLDTYQRRMRG